MFEDLYVMEMEARDIYKNLVLIAEDEKIKTVADKIRKDEERHMEIALKLKKIAENGN